jgi:predicted transcriptional regulator
VILGCIDDFAIKKGHTYGTLMVDIPSHRVLDIIDTRETQSVKQWLRGFPQLQFVSRDGSIGYKSAITQANEKITQISDRFHLLKGVTDAAKKYISGYFKANIGLPVSKAPSANTKTAFYWKKDTGHTDSPTGKHTRATERKMRLVAEATRLKHAGCALVKIARLIGVSAATVKKYLKSGFNPESSGYNTTCWSKIKPYAEDIKNILEESKTFKHIECVIRKKGFDGAASTIRMFATRERKLLKQAGEGAKGVVEKIHRKWLLSLLYKPIDKIKELSEEQFNKVIKQNPVIGNIFALTKSFKETLFSKREDKLDTWLEQAKSLGIEEINSFVGGINRDIEAVKNAITYDYNNGLAEGSVNKLKVIKRIMYGRCSFNLLRKKLLLLESKSKFN